MKRSQLNFLIDAVAFAGVIALTSTGLLMRFILTPFQGGEGGAHGPKMLWGLDRHQWGEVHFWIAAGLMAVLVVHLFLHWRWIVSVVQNKPHEGSGMRAVLGILGLISLLVLAAVPFFSSVEQAPRHKKQERRGVEQASPALETHKQSDPSSQQAPFEPRVFKKQDKDFIDGRKQGEEKRNQNESVREPESVSSDEKDKGIAKPAQKEQKKEAGTPSQKDGSSDVFIRGNMTLKEVQETTDVPVSHLIEQLGLPPDTSPDERLGRLRRQYGFKMSVVRKAVSEYNQMTKKSSSR